MLGFYFMMTLTRKALATQNGNQLPNEEDRRRRAFILLLSFWRMCVYHAHCHCRVLNLGADAFTLVRAAFAGFLLDHGHPWACWGLKAPMNPSSDSITVSVLQARTIWSLQLVVEPRSEQCRSLRLASDHVRWHKYFRHLERPKASRLQMPLAGA